MDFLSKGNQNQWLSTSKKAKTTTDTKPAKKPESNASRQSSKDSTESKKTKKSLAQTQDKENDRKKNVFRQKKTPLLKRVRLKKFQ